jgi:hypothetical protein
MHDDIGIVHELSEELTIFDIVEVILEVLAGFQMTDIFDAAGGEIVEQDDTIAAVKKPLRQMRSDKTSAASD